MKQHFYSDVYLLKCVKDYLSIFDYILIYQKSSKQTGKAK